MNHHDPSIKLLTELADMLAQGVVIFDRALNRISFINVAAEKLTGLHRESTLVDIRTIVNGLSDDDQKYLAMHAARLKEKTQSGSIELRLPKVGARAVDINASAYALQNGAFVIVFIEDITKNREHEGYLIEFGAKKNTTLDGIAHFMSGALTLIRNLSDQAGRSMRSQNVASMNTYLELIDQNTSHCVEVIRNLLQEEHGKSPTISVKVSRSNIVEKVGYIVQNLKMSYPLRVFEFNFENDKITAEVDEFKLLQIINNLASNAIKFSDADKPITFGVSDVDGRVLTYISDQGIGIPSALQPFIFERNSRAGRPGLNGEQSFGKGLSICKALSILMDADIWFESAEGSGSTFYLSIPKIAEHHVSPPLLNNKVKSYTGSQSRFS